MIGFEIDDRERVFGTVAMGGDAAEFEPAVIGHAVAMHGAVEEDGGGAFLVRFEDAVCPFDVLDFGEAFVMDDHVVSFGPIVVFVEGNLGIGGGAAFVDDRPIDIEVCAFGDAGGNDDFLVGVVVAAAAGDEEGFEFGARCWILVAGCLLDSGEGEEGGGGEEGEGEEDGFWFHQGE